MFNKAFAAAAFAGLASAAPTLLRRQEAPNPNDVLVLQFAQVLNQLEQQFYSQALQKFQASDITSAGFTSAELVVEQLTVIQGDESSHITALQSALTSDAQTPVTSCSFDFSSVLTDVTTTVTVARLVENVGVGAFLGAAHLISDPTILQAAASIVTTEARHQTMLNILNDGAAIPNPFDLPLLPNEVLAIAGPFISGCDLGVQANPSLTITNTESIQTGTQLSFSSSAINGSMDGMFCQLLAGGMSFSLSLPATACAVPASLTGPVAVWITSDDQPLNNNARDRTNLTTVAGPAMMFIDNTPQAISQLVRSTGANITSTSTITPDQASSLLSSAATATPAAVAPTDTASTAVAASDATPTAVAAPDTASTAVAAADTAPTPAAVPGATIQMIPNPALAS